MLGNACYKFHCWGGTIESPWLRFGHIIIKPLDRLIPIIEIFTHRNLSLLKEISDILKDILPVIDIC